MPLTLVSVYDLRAISGKLVQMDKLLLSGYDDL